MRKAIKVMIGKAEALCKVSETISKNVLEKCDPESVPVYAFRGALLECQRAIKKVKGEA